MLFYHSRQLYLMKNFKGTYFKNLPLQSIPHCGILYTAADRKTVGDDRFLPYRSPAANAAAGFLR
jgi:hypothetical protein